jgi:hypothetical protein
MTVQRLGRGRPGFWPTGSKAVPYMCHSYCTGSNWASSESFFNSLTLPRTATGDSSVYWADSFAKFGYPSYGPEQLVATRHC